MSTGISGPRIRKELSKHIPPHRITQSDAFRLVTVQPDSPQELHFIVGFAAREGVPVVPAGASGRPPQMEGWHIRVSFSRMSAISDFSSESGLVCAQAGTRIQDLSDWLMDKGYALMVRPDLGADMELWEFLLSPDAGNFGPRHGCKWDQVFALSAVLPSGRLFQNTLSPARASGPDFSRVILLGQGTFGIPLEVYFKVRKLPRRRTLTAYAVTDFAEAVERAWVIAREARPEFLELGINRRSSPPGIPEMFAVVELWGEGKEVAGRRELVRKHFGDAARPTDIAYEVLLGFEDTYQFETESRVQFFADRGGVADVVRGVLAAAGGPAGPATLRLRGFAENQACVTAECTTEACCRLLAPQRSAFSSAAGDPLLKAAAGHLDPMGVFASIPRLWEETKGGPA